VANTTTNVKHQAEDAADKAKEAADKAKDAGSGLMDKAKQVAGTVAEKAKDVASNVGEKVDSGVSAVGRGMESLAGTIRDKGPSSGILGGAASGVATALDTSGQYLEEQGLSGMAEDVTNLIRRNPIPAMLIGIGLGFLLARMTRR
jgi:phage-related tail protein